MAGERQILQFAQYIHSSQRIVVLTGAGMSTESGIPDFRSAHGLWEEPSRMDEMSETYFRNYPEKFWIQFRKLFLSPNFLQALPNAGHMALAGLQTNKQVQIFTQNVDGLHQSAGSRNVFELHGSIQSARCPKCNARYSLADVLGVDLPECRNYTMKGECDGVLHPDVVLFEEDIRYYSEAVGAIKSCDLLIVLGTSLTVFPVAELPKFRRHECPLVIVNLEATYLDGEADLVIHDSISNVLSESTLPFW